MNKVSKNPNLIPELQFTPFSTTVVETNGTNPWVFLKNNPTGFKWIQVGINIDPEFKEEIIILEISDFPNTLTLTENDLGDIYINNNAILGSEKRMVVRNPTDNNLFDYELLESSIFTENKSIFNFEYPEWYSGLIIPIIENGKLISTTFDIEKLNWVQKIIFTETPYYISTTGNDSNDGLTELTPKKTIVNSLSIGAKLIYMLEGNYHKSTFGVNYNLNGDEVVIIGVGKVRICGYHSGQTWTNISGNAWQTTQSNASTADGVLDFLNLDSDGYGSILTQVNTEAECIATAGTWHVDSGGADFYTVHMIDGRAVNNGIDMTANLTGSASFKSDNGKLLMNNIENIFDLSFQSLTSNSNFELYLLNYKIPYPKSYKTTDSGSKNGLSLNGVTSYLQNCFGQNSSSDVVNYHNTIGILNMTILELDCEFKNPNYQGKNTNSIYQASTAHENISILRVNSVLINGDKDVLKDVGTSQTVVVGGIISNDGSIRAGQDVGIISVIDGFFYKTELKGAGDIEGAGVEGATLVNCEIDPNRTLIGNVTIIK